MSQPSHLRTIVALCLLAAALSAQAEVVGTNRNAELDELSGLAVSRRNPGVIWAHNDSGDAPRLFAITPAGALLGTYALEGASAVDWEDMAIGRDPDGGTDYLYVADIGDNARLRPGIEIYRVREPVVDPTLYGTSNTLDQVEHLRFVYEDGAHNAETLMADPETGDLIVIAKAKKKEPTGIYRAVLAASPGGTNTFTLVGHTPVSRIVGGDISPSGRQLLLKNYKEVFLFTRNNGQSVAEALTNAPTALPYVQEEQGEAIGWDCNEQGYYTASEGLDQPIHHYVPPR